jgi:prevent-host-death family protein
LLLVFSDYRQIFLSHHRQGHRTVFIAIIVHISYNVITKVRKSVGGATMFITATELKNNLGKYLDLANKEDIIITKNGKQIAKLTSVTKNKQAIAESLMGILPSDITLEEAREGRLQRHESID